MLEQSLALRSLALLTPLLFLSGHASAALHSTGTLDIHVSGESYTSSVLDYISGAVTEQNGAPYEILSDGVKFNPAQHIGGGGDSGIAATGALMFGLSDLGFFAKSGYKITGYEFSFSGHVFTSDPAFAYARGTFAGSGEYSDFAWGGYTNLTPYTISTSIAAANSAGGNVSADGWLYFDTPQLYDSYIDPWGSTVVYPSGASRVDISLDSLTVRAVVAPIPEPETSLMFLAGIGAIARRMRRGVEPPTTA